jgi:septum formation protein
MKNSRQIILASASKRRSAILHSCGIRHKIMVSGATEIHKKNSPAAKIVIENARRKTNAVAKNTKNSIVIGADTLVEMKGRLIGKPKSKKEAMRLLRLFSGNRVNVFTGLYLFDTVSRKSACDCAKSSLYVQNIPKEDIGQYFKILMPYDKAGGFTIEGTGSLIFDDIRGSYFNILGLPMNTLEQLFKKIGLSILDYISIRHLAKRGV